MNIMNTENKAVIQQLGVINQHFFTNPAI